MAWYDEPQPPKPASEQHYDNVIAMLTNLGVRGKDLIRIKDELTDYRQAVLMEGPRETEK